MDTWWLFWLRLPYEARGLITLALLREEASEKKAWAFPALIGSPLQTSSKGRLTLIKNYCIGSPFKLSWAFLAGLFLRSKSG